jgi:hypothetical protein
MRASFDMKPVDDQVSGSHRDPLPLIVDCFARPQLIIEAND